MKRFEKILTILSEAVLIGILTLNKGSAVMIFSTGRVRKNNEKVVRHVAETLDLIMHRTSFDNIFHGEYISVDTFVNDLFTLLRAVL